MLNTIAPFWDGNETWLVVIGASLFAAFPVVYAVFLGAFYIPVLLLLFGLIFRGIAFEFRGRSKRMRGCGTRASSSVPPWSRSCRAPRSARMMRGIPVVDGQYAGTTFDWVHPFPILHRNRAGAWVRVARRVLAGAEERRGAPRLGLRADPVARAWPSSSYWDSRSRIAVTVDAGRDCAKQSAARHWGLMFPVLGVAALLGVIAGARARRDARAVRPHDAVLRRRLSDARRDVRGRT